MEENAAPPELPKDEAAASDTNPAEPTEPEESKKVQIDQGDQTTTQECPEANESFQSVPEFPPCPAVPSSSQTDLTPAEQIYHVKWVQYERKARVPVVTQNENGPCPLLAIMNVLLLRGQVTLEDDVQIVTAQQLMERLGDCILRLSLKHVEQESQTRVDFEQNISDAMAVLPKLLTGLDVNVKFTGISHFEYTPECIVFDLLGMVLYHGWLVDPQQGGWATAVGQRSYNQLVEKIITDRHSGDPTIANNAAQLELFLESTASQLTYHGLCELTQHLKDGELAVFFRNNHFSTMLKHNDELFLLVTDQGFLYESRVVWETLNNVDGDSHFVDAAFLTMPPKTEPLISNATPDEMNKLQQNDYLMALSLEEEERRRAGAGAETAETQAESGVDLDEQLAWQLQQDENRRAEHQSAPPSGHVAQSRPITAAGGSGNSSRRSSQQDRGCSIL